MAPVFESQLSIMILSVTLKKHNTHDKRHSVSCAILLIFIVPSVIMLNVIMLNVIMLNVILLNVVVSVFESQLSIFDNQNNIKKTRYSLQMSLSI
jgi:hypothetical protein